MENVRIKTDPEIHAKLEAKARAEGKTMDEYLDDHVQSLKELLAVMEKHGDSRRCWTRFT